MNDEAKKAEVNRKREILLKEIKEIEHLNLKHVSEHLASNNSGCLVDDISKLFVSFCFVLKFDKDIWLIVTDSFLSKNQVELFQKLINLPRTYPTKSEAKRKESYGHFFDMDLSEVNIF